MKKILLAWWLLCGVESQGFDPKDLATGIFANTPTTVTKFDSQEEVVQNLQQSQQNGCTIVEGIEHTYDLKVEEKTESKMITTKQVTDVTVK